MFVGLCCNTSTTEWRTRASILPPHRTQPPCASICGPGRRKVFQRQRHASAAEGAAAAAAANSTDRNPYGWDTVIENSKRTPTRTRRAWCYRRRAVPHLNLHTPGTVLRLVHPGRGDFVVWRLQPKATLLVGLDTLPENPPTGGMTNLNKLKVVVIGSAKVGKSGKCMCVCVKRGGGLQGIERKFLCLLLWLLRI